MKPRGRGLAAQAPVDATGLFCATGYLLLALLARRPGEPQLAQFLALLLWTGLPVFGLYWLAGRRHLPVSPGRLFFWALAFRLCGLYGGPLLEDDHHRYLWDGYRFATQGTPYGAAPEDFFADPAIPAAFQAVLSQVNNPELQTIYAPVTQCLFLLAHWLWPARIEALQALLILVDVASIALLLRFAPARAAMLYAWCPLVVKEVAFTAHPDGIGVFLLLAALALARKDRWHGAAVLLGMAAGAKVLALVIAPLLLARASAVHWLSFAGTLAAAYAPFAMAGGTDAASLAIFAARWEFNSAIFGPLNALLGRLEASLLLGLAYAALWLAYARHFLSRAAPLVPRGDWLYAALFVVAPVINPWYLLWLLPFAAIFPSAWAWTASLAVMLSYVTGLNLGDSRMQPYAQPLWARALEFGLIGAALLLDWRQRRAAGAAGRAGWRRERRA